MRDKIIAFLNKTASYTVSNPGFAPCFMEVPEFNKDIKLAEGLKPLPDVYEQLSNNLVISAFRAAAKHMSVLMYYSSVKITAKTGQPGARSIYDDLSVRFPRPKEKSTPPPPPAVL